ncbi:pleckstrin homology-like domain family B member 1 isoform X2 [Amphibalanus amphitrite]|uniref:pleckstrin homology-like domain family B member 1 isoform X2 n=1 Tax=Amphibalanus amphitrite TaxID=1232801 RepID=UPI001C91541A|nr:pleckstrin homology-like domain family B member 1 isoform X2 [Amphibalanus amphitrite]
MEAGGGTRPAGMSSPPRWTGLHAEYSPPRTASEPGQRSETRRPHLVNYGASRLSTPVSFIPLPEHGRLVIGVPDRTQPPDISIQGSGVERSHAVLETGGPGGGVLLRPQAGVTTVDGIRCAAPVQLTSALDNPEYYHMGESGGGGGPPVSPRLQLPPPKPPRQPASEGPFTGEYLYTRLERPAGPAPAARTLPPPRAAPPPSPYDNVPPTAAAARAAAAAAAAAQGGDREQPSVCSTVSQDHPDSADALQQLEQSRLDEILHMCAEYDSQMAGGPLSGPAARPPDSPAVAHRRIKTNGSLPRDRRLGSPGADTPPEPRRRSASEDELSPAAAAAADVRSPYENVSFVHYPQSPRTRIRTTVQRERLDGAGREASPPVSTAGAVYMVPPPPVPLPTPPPRAPLHSGGMVNGSDGRGLQFVNEEYMRGLPLDPSFQNDDLVFLPAVGGGYVNTGMDEETRRAAAELQHRQRLGNVYQQLPSRPPVESPLPGLQTDGRAPSESELPGSLSTPAEEEGGSARVSWRDDVESNSGDEMVRHSRSFSDTTDDDREMCRRLKDQRRMTYRQLSELRQQKLDLEHQESEAIRQLEMEHALLEGEVETHQETVARLEQEVTDLRETLASRTEGREQTRRRQTQEADQLAARIVAAEAELERLELLSEKFRGTTDEETELLEKLKYQHELVEQERKAHEDQEFHHMEDQVGWETEKEESLRVIHQLERRIANTRAEMESVREQQRRLIESIRSDTEAMERQRREIVKQMCQERDRLRKTQRRLSSLSQSGVDEAADDPGLDEPEQNSDQEEFSSNEYIESRLAQLHMLGKSRDDLQRIQNVTASSPMQVDNRSSTTLREIERNRHVLLAKQGTQVIEDERRRVEELKRRVQDEVTAQWEEQRRQQHSAQSPTPETAGEPAPPTAPRVTNGHSSHEEAPRSPASGDRSPPISDGGRELQPISEDGQPPRPMSGENGRQQRPMSGEDGRQQPMSDEEDEPRSPRPVSDASSVFDGVEEPPVRRRSKVSVPPQQRPLTRYLPITNQQFDLRQHIESAGHQLEMCHQVVISRHACRGYLHKLSSRIRSWQKRWFVFDRSKNKRTFMYYSDKSESKARGGVYFQAIEEVYVDHLKTSRGSAPNTTFCVKTMSRTFYLMAPSPEAMRIWVDVIMTGAEGNAVFGHG